MLLARYSKYIIEAGVDEVGRGCIAGPVVAAAVVLPETFSCDLVKDSKLLSATDREKAEKVIRAEAISFAIAAVDNIGIDEINILQASFKAMHKALNKLPSTPEHILVDGNCFVPYYKIPHICVVKGDSKYYSIAAASILAKNFRDAFMHRQARFYKGYGWETNVGYPTPKHKQAVMEKGLTPLHRKSFSIFSKQLSLFEHGKH
jgi:ribonuclease HII